MLLFSKNIDLLKDSDELIVQSYDKYWFVESSMHVEILIIFEAVCCWPADEAKGKLNCMFTSQINII